MTRMMHPYRTQATRPDYPEPCAQLPRRSWSDRNHDRIMAVGIAIGLGFTGCGLFGQPHGPTREQMAAEATYGSMLLSCVEEAKTLAESKACRARVDAAWGVTSTGRDGGR